MVDVSMAVDGMHLVQQSNVYTHVSYTPLNHKIKHRLQLVKYYYSVPSAVCELGPTNLS